MIAAQELLAVIAARESSMITSLLERVRALAANLISLPRLDSLDISGANVVCTESDEEPPVADASSPAASSHTSISCAEAWGDSAIEKPNRHVYHYCGFMQQKPGETIHMDGVVSLVQPVKGFEDMRRVKALIAEHDALDPSQLILQSLSYLGREREESDDRTDYGPKIKHLLSALDAKQAKIDSLMMEFCPGEMAHAQRIEWAIHQRPEADALEAIRKLRHFAACVAAGSWTDPKQAARDVLSMTKEFERPDESTMKTGDPT